MTKNEVNINEVIREMYVVPESLFDHKRTKTSHFMLNTIFPNNSITGTEYFVNAFLDDYKFKHKIERPLFLMFKTPPKDNKWSLLYSRLITKAEYIMDYIVGWDGSGFIRMLVFQVPEKYANEYYNFREGKYSKFSDTYKKLFNRYKTNDRAQPEESIIWRVLHKSEELRKELVRFFGEDVVFLEEDELWGIAEPKYEIYRYE